MSKSHAFWHNEIQKIQRQREAEEEARRTAAENAERARKAAEEIERARKAMDK